MRTAFLQRRTAFSTALPRGLPRSRRMPARGRARPAAAQPSPGRRRLNPQVSVGAARREPGGRAGASAPGGQARVGLGQEKGKRGMTKATAQTTTDQQKHTSTHRWTRRAGVAVAAGRMAGTQHLPASWGRLACLLASGGVVVAGWLAGALEGRLRARPPAPVLTWLCEQSQAAHAARGVREEGHARARTRTRANPHPR